MARVGNVRGEEVEDAIGQATAIRTDFALYLQRFFPASSSPPSLSPSAASSSRPEMAAVGRALYSRTEAHIGVTRELLERLEAELETMNGDAPSAQEEQVREWLEAIDEEDAALDDVAATLEEQLGMGGDENENDHDHQESEKGQGQGGRAAGPTSNSGNKDRPGHNGNGHDHEDDEEEEEEEDDIVSKAASPADAAPMARGGIASVSSRGSEERPRSSHMRGQRLLSGSPLAQHAMSLRNSARQPPLSPLAEAPSGNTSAGSSPTLRRQRQPSYAAAHSEPAVLDLADGQVAGANGSASASAVAVAAALAPVNPPYPVICAEGHEALTEAELTIIAGEQVVFLGGDGGTGWSMVENGRGQQGFVPTDFLDLPAEPHPLPPPPSINVDNFTPQKAKARSASEGDMLDARGDVDSSAAMKLNRLVSQTTLNQRLGRDQRTSGFCASTLMAVAAKLEHKLSHVVLPTVNNSGLAYVDLRLDEATGKLKPHEVSVTRTFKLVDAKRVPFLQTTVLGDVEERIVRVALFDKQYFLGNVFTLRAQWSGKNDDVWKWTSASDMPGAKESDSICLVRTDSSSPDLCLVFELAIRLRNIDGPFDVSCGWGRLPLFKTNGNPNSSKTHDIRLFQGSPLDVPALSANGGVLHVKLSNINQTAKILCDSLPRTILCQLTSVPIVSLYRDLMADALLRQSESLTDAAPSFNVLLKCMPVMLDDSHLTSIFRSVWNDSLKLLKKSQKKDEAFVRSWFQRTFIEKVYPVLFMAGVGTEPSLSQEDRPDTFHEREALKQAVCERFMRGDPVDQLTLPYVMRPRQIGYLHAPFHSSEATFDLLSINARAY